MSRSTIRGGHAGKNGYTTQIGSYNFTTFRTGPSKSRLAFLSRLCGGVSLYVMNDAALAYMEERNLPQIVIGKFKEHKARIFSSAGDGGIYLHALGLSAMKVAPNPVLIASEAALWGAIHHQGLLPDTVIVSDDAGQFRVGAHALCWIHAERLVHKLVPANDKQRNATLLHGGFARRVLTSRRLRSCYSSEYRTPELVHPVEGLDGNCNFSRTTGIVA